MKSGVRGQSLVVSAAALLLALQAGAYEHTWANMFFDTTFNTNARIQIAARYIPDDTRFPTNGSGRVSERLKWGYLGSFSAYMERDLFSRSLFSGDEARNFYDRIRYDPRYLVGGDSQDFLYDADPYGWNGGHMTAFRAALFVPGQQGHTTTSRTIEHTGGRIMPSEWLDAICSQAHLVWNTTIGLGKMTFSGCFTVGAGWREIPWAENPAQLEREYHWYSLLMPALCQCQEDQWKTAAPSRHHIEDMIDNIRLETGLEYGDIFNDPSDPLVELPVPAIPCSLYTNIMDIAGEKAADSLCDTNTTKRLSYSQMAGVNAATSLAKSSWSMGLGYLPIHKEAPLAATNGLFALRKRKIEVSTGGVRSTGLVAETRPDDPFYIAFRISRPSDPGYYASDEFTSTNAISDPEFVAKYHNNPGCAWITNGIVESAGIHATGDGTIELDPMGIIDEYTNTIYGIITGDIADFPDPKYKVCAELWTAPDDYALVWYVESNQVVIAGPYSTMINWPNILSLPNTADSFGAELDYGFKVSGDWRYTETNGLGVAGMAPPREYWASNIVTAVSLWPMWLCQIDATTSARVYGTFASCFETSGGGYIDGAWAGADWRGLCTALGSTDCGTAAQTNRGWMDALLAMNAKVKAPTTESFFASRLFPTHDFGGTVRRPNFPEPSETIVLSSTARIADAFDAMQGRQIWSGRWQGFSVVDWDEYWSPDNVTANRVYLTELDPNNINEFTVIVNIREFVPSFIVGAVTNEWTVAHSRPQIANALFDMTMGTSEWMADALPYVTNKVDYCVPPFAIQTLPVDVEKVDWNFYNLRP